MNDGDALLAAILASPDDDTPRLVYADWLDENGDPERARFIRLQCPTGGPDSDDPEAEDRAAGLEVVHGRKWLAGLPRFPGVSWEFRRGFPEALSVPGELFLERYESFVRVPWVRRLCLDDLDNSLVRDFVSRRWNPGWVELELIDEPSRMADSTPAVLAVANSGQARQLRKLQFSLFDLTRDAVAALAAAPNLTQLRELRVEGDANSLFLLPLRERFGDRLVADWV